MQETGRKLPSLNALRAFEAAGRHQNVSRAAAELHVTPGAISRHIKLLELELGQPLFDRHPRGIHLTEAGRRYRDRLTGIFDEIGQATQEMRKASHEPELRISAYATVSAEWLVPRLGRFRDLHPEIKVSLIASHNPPLVERGAADVGVRLGDGNWPDLDAELLFEEIYVPVCSPRLIASALPLRTPEDLTQHTLLYSPPHVRFWADWFSAAGIAPRALGRSLRFDNAALAYSAARSGEGVALGKWYVLADELAAGRLVVPFGPLLSTKRSHYVISLNRRVSETAIAAFRDWILSEAATTRGAISSIVGENKFPAERAN